LIGTGLPISAFPNLCLLESTINRKKESNIYYEYFDNQIKLEESTKEQIEIAISNIENFTHSNRDELDFVTSVFV